MGTLFAMIIAPGNALVLIGTGNQAALTVQPSRDVTAGLRTLRCTKDLGDVFDRACSEIRTLARAVESVLTHLLKELEPPFPAPEINAPEATLQGGESRMAEAFGVRGVSEGRLKP
jgi:hypothetical protein